MQTDCCVNVVVGIVVVLHYAEHFQGVLGAEGIGVVVDGVFEDSIHFIYIDRRNLHTPEVLVLPDGEGISL